MLTRLLASKHAVMDERDDIQHAGCKGHLREVTDISKLRFMDFFTSCCGHWKITETMSTYCSVSVSSTNSSLSAIHTLTSKQLCFQVSIFCYILRQEHFRHRSISTSSGDMVLDYGRVGYDLVILKTKRCEVCRCSLFILLFKGMGHFETRIDSYAMRTMVTSGEKYLNGQNHCLVMVPSRKPV